MVRAVHEIGPDDKTCTAQVVQKRGEKFVRRQFRLNGGLEIGHRQAGAIWMGSMLGIDTVGGFFLQLLPKHIIDSPVSQSEDLPVLLKRGESRDDVCCTETSLHKQLVFLHGA